MTFRRSSSLNAIRDIYRCDPSLPSDKSLTPTVAAQCLQRPVPPLSPLDESQLQTNSALPVLNVPELDAHNAPLYPPVPFKCLDNGQLVTFI